MCHVLPDGASTRISFGILNLTHHTSHADPEPLIPGEDIRITIPLDQCAYRIPKGHKLRVAISSAYWPLLWPMPEPATLTLSEGHLDLPVRPTAEKAEWVFPEPEAEAPWDIEVLREDTQSQITETDLGTGKITVRIERDNGKRRDREHGLISGSKSREWWSIHPDDPLSARAKTHWTEEVERDDLRMRTETHAEMRADSEAFHLKGRLMAYENDVLIYEREIEDVIPRDFK
jgi:hypothetical protein